MHLNKKRLKLKEIQIINLGKNRKFNINLVVRNSMSIIILQTEVDRRIKRQMKRIYLWNNYQFIDRCYKVIFCLLLLTHPGHEHLVVAGRVGEHNVAVSPVLCAKL